MMNCWPSMLPGSFTFVSPSSFMKLKSLMSGFFFCGRWSGALSCSERYALGAAESDILNPKQSCSVRRLASHTGTCFCCSVAGACAVAGRASALSAVGSGSSLKNDFLSHTSAFPDGCVTYFLLLSFEQQAPMLTCDSCFLARENLCLGELGARIGQLGASDARLAPVLR